MFAIADALRLIAGLIDSGPTIALANVIEQCVETGLATNSYIAGAETLPASGVRR
jgi:hypothetical protein